MNYNPFSLSNKTVLVTGASSGIGRAVAIECSKAGANLFITARNSERLDETLKLLAISGCHTAIAADLTNMEEMRKLVDSLPQIDGIVNCAGMLKKQPFKFINEELFDATMRVNFFGPAMLTQLIFKKKKLNEHSSIVFISSIAAHVASYGSVMYMSSKGALNSLARGMALELAPKGIRVNCIEPGLVKTKLTEALTTEDLDNYEKRYPLGRFGQPEEIAYGTIYLLSDASKWITGTTLTIDGGITLS